MWVSIPKYPFSSMTVETMNSPFASINSSFDDIISLLTQTFDNVPENTIFVYAYRTHTKVKWPYINYCSSKITILIP